MITVDNQTTLPIDSTTLTKIANSLTTQEIELLIVNTQTIQKLNKHHRDKNTSTDVLSFPIDALEVPELKAVLPLGTIVICDAFIIENAQAFSHTLQDELSLLFIHGLLHLLGHDHETDKGEMRAKEKEIITTFHLPQSLIIRTQKRR